MIKKNIFRLLIIGVLTILVACADKGENPENRAPQITSAVSVDAIIDEELSYTATASDPDGTTPVLHFANIPSWMDTSGAVISGTPGSTTPDTSFTVIAADDELADTLVVAVNVTSASTQVSYATTIQPIFTNNCAGSSCHIGGDEADLRLGNYSQLMQGSRSGAIVIPGNPDGSILVRQVEGTRSPRMPLGGAALSSAQIQAIRDWIEQGAQNN